MASKRYAPSGANLVPAGTRNDVQFAKRCIEHPSTKRNELAVESGVAILRG